jgi:ribosomal protein S12 methylthiotransferase
MGYAYVKIAEGCDNHCTFCVIPALRGAYRSRGIGDIVAEARGIARRDMEIVLVAQDTTRYGMDVSPAPALAPVPVLAAAPASASALAVAPAPAGGSGCLCELVGELSRIEHVRWIRLLYSYPELIGRELIDCMADSPKLLKYLDMPVQHASDSVLRRMGRRAGRRQLDALIAELRARMPGIVLRTTVMTGFPGESDDDFAQLKDFVAATRFDRLGVFAYSREDGTPAASMDRQVPRKVAAARRLEIIRLQDAISAASDRRRIGTECDAIVERPAPASFGGAASGGPERMAAASGIAAGKTAERKIAAGEIAERGSPKRGNAPRAQAAGARFAYLCRTYGEAPDIDGHVYVESEHELGAGTFARVRIVQPGRLPLQARLRGELAAKDGKP